MHNNNTQLLEYIYFCRKNIVGKYSIYRVIIMHPHRMPNYYHLSYAPFTHAGTGGSHASTTSDVFGGSVSLEWYILFALKF